MRSKLFIIALCSSVAACNTPNMPTQGVASVNVPVVTASDYRVRRRRSRRPDRSRRSRRGSMAGSRASASATAIRSTSTAPMPTARGRRSPRSPAATGSWFRTAPRSRPGWSQPGSVRVVVSRRRAGVPNCPNWSEPPQPNFNNRSMSNFGCGVNSQPRRDGRQSDRPRPRPRRRRRKRRHGRDQGCSDVPRLAADRHFAGPRVAAAR